MLKGIDISYANGKVDFDKAKKSVDFIIIRAGYGQGNIDKQFIRNIKECNRLGIPCGVYWFSYALNADMARKEAQFCINAIKPYQVEWGVWFDLENDSIKYASKLGKDISPNAHAKAFLEEVTNSGYLAGNYTNADYTRRKVYNKEILAYPTWLAIYPNNNGSEPKGNVQHITPHDIWQYTSKGEIDGIKGDVDVNIAYVDYSKKEDDVKDGWIKSEKWQYWENNIQQKSLWVESADKKNWYYIKSDGFMAENEVLQIGTELFYFLNDGRMAITNDRGALI